VTSSAVDIAPTNFFSQLRPYPGENTASRPISHSQAPESPVSIVVGDHTRILGAAIIFLFISKEMVLLFPTFLFRFQPKFSVLVLVVLLV
jgi:hypothetical protein